MTRAQHPACHLLVRTSKEPFGVERYHGYCGRVGITKRDYNVSMARVTCPLCLEKISKKGQDNGSKSQTV